MENQLMDPSSTNANFLCALKADETKKQYPHRLDKFLSFIGLGGDFPEKCANLLDLSKNAELLQSQLMRFLNSQKERIKDNDISEGTLSNYIKGIKLFCTMNYIMMN
jgi:hypothetical protein